MECWYTQGSTTCVCIGVHVFTVQILVFGQWLNACLIRTGSIRSMAGYFVHGRVRAFLYARSMLIHSYRAETLDQFSSIKSFPLCCESEETAQSPETFTPNLQVFIHLFTDNKKSTSVHAYAWVSLICVCLCGYGWMCVIVFHSNGINYDSMLLKIILIIRKFSD